MNIQPNWIVTDKGPWQLIYNDKCIISISEVNGITSTQANVFVGTKEECEGERIRLNLPWSWEIAVNIQYRLVYNNQFIITFFGPKIDSEVYVGNEFLGTKEECETEITRLNLSYTQPELLQE